MSSAGAEALTDRSDEQVLAIYADETRPRRERETAFHVLVTRFQRRVFAVCSQVLWQPADAEDATQEVFVRLARSAAGFRGEAKLSTWLYTVARNVATDRVRHDARRPSVPVGDGIDVADHGHPDDDLAEDAIGARETALTVGAALEQLDETSRQLLVLVAVEGLSYDEAAAVADLPVGTVKSRVSRARVRLGTLLAERTRSDADATGPRREPRRTAADAVPDGADPARGPPA